MTSRLKVLLVLCVITALVVARVHRDRARPELPYSRGTMCGYERYLLTSRGLDRTFSKDYYMDVRSFEFSVFETVDCEGEQRFRARWEYPLDGRLVDARAATPESAYLAIEREGEGTTIERWDLQEQAGGLELKGEAGSRSLQVIGGGPYVCPEQRGKPEFKLTPVASLPPKERVLHMACDFEEHWLLAIVVHEGDEENLTAKVLDLRTGRWTVVTSTDNERALHDTQFASHLIHEKLGRAFLIHPNNPNEDWVLLREPDRTGQWKVATYSYYDFEELPGAWEAIEILAPLEDQDLLPPTVSEVLCQ